MDRAENIRRLKMQAALPKPKKMYVIPSISKKKQQEMDAEKKDRVDGETELQKWFKARQREMVGVCQCGCGNKSQKLDNMFFRHSAAHVFPQRLFRSIAYHPLNWVERAFFGGCHSNMDDKSMDLWPGMADWDDIKAKFHYLSPLLTIKERSTKFYSRFEKIVNEN